MNVESASATGVFQRRFGVSRETIDLLLEYQNLLEKWNRKINLVSRQSLVHSWQRHFSDSAQLWKLKPLDANNWLDIGSGAGFPALVLVILNNESKGLVKFTLVESDQRKCAFLHNVCHRLDLNVTIFDGRIDALPDQKFDVISARALASLPKLLEMSERFATRSTVCIFPKGASYATELVTAQQEWQIDCNTTSSLTDADSVILRIERFSRAK